MNKIISAALSAAILATSAPAPARAEGLFELLRMARAAHHVGLGTRVRADGSRQIRPDPSLTPGEVLTSDPGQVCHAGYSRGIRSMLDRHERGRMIHAVYERYGTDRNGRIYEDDHLVPLGLGGADTIGNQWTQIKDGGAWDASVKDRLEYRLVDWACWETRDPSEQQARLQRAQADLRADWIAAYGKYCPTDAACPAYGDVHGAE